MFARVEWARDLVEAARALPGTTQPADRRAKSRMMGPPRKSPVWNELGPLALRVPDDHRWRAAMVKFLLLDPRWRMYLWLPDGSLLPQWVDMKCPEAAELLAETARADPERQVGHSPGWKRSIRYFRWVEFPARESAGRVLSAWGYPAPSDVLTPAHPRSAAGFLTFGAGILCGTTAAFVLLGRRV